MGKNMRRTAIAVAWILMTMGMGCAQEKAAAPGRKNQLTVDLGQGVKMEFVLIRPGSFAMGSEKGEADEKPVHPVKITKPFYMGVYEVTQAQWKAVTGDNPSYFKGDDLPVEMVSWEDCQGFLGKLKEKMEPGLSCRLPSEAEWEYACRAGAKTEYCFGDDEASLGEYAWYDSNSDFKTHPVGKKKPNPWGLYDMHGNVWEWCADWLADDYYGKSPTDDPSGPASGRDRVLRGGSWFSDFLPDYVRSATRGRYSPSNRLNYCGFRVVALTQESF